MFGLIALQSHLANGASVSRTLGEMPGAASLSAAASALQDELNSLKERSSKLRGIAVGEPHPGAPATAGGYDAELDFDFAGTAIVTMAAGNAAARGAIALMQSLRTTGTRAAELVVMLSRGGEGSPECRDLEWKAARGRENVECTSDSTIEDEIVSPAIIAVLRQKLGVRVFIADMIPSTDFTADIAGGRSTFWGMALNKMQVFNMTQYKKLLWMDSEWPVGSLRGINRSNWVSPAHQRLLCNVWYAPAPYLTRPVPVLYAPRAVPRR